MRPGMYNAYLCFLSLVKMDFVCGLTLVVMAFYFFEQQLGEGVLLVAALVVTLVWALMGWQAVIRETRWTMHVYFALALCEPAFIVYKLLRLFAMEHSMLKPHVTKGQFAVVGTWAHACVRSRAALTRARTGICGDRRGGAAAAHPAPGGCRALLPELWAGLVCHG